MTSWTITCQIVISTKMWPFPYFIRFASASFLLGKCVGSVNRKQVEGYDPVFKDPT